MFAKMNKPSVIYLLAPDYCMVISITDTPDYCIVINITDVPWSVLEQVEM